MPTPDVPELLTLEHRTEAQNMALYLHESFNGFWFDENGNGIKLCLLQPLDSIARHIQDAVLPLERRQSGSVFPTQSTQCTKQLAPMCLQKRGPQR